MRIFSLFVFLLFLCDSASPVAAAAQENKADAPGKQLSERAGPDLAPQPRENKVDVLEKQLRATQEYMFTEFGRLAKGEGEKGGGKKELSPLFSALQKNQFKALIRSKYEYVEEGRNSGNNRVAPVSGVSMCNVRFWFDGEVNDRVGYRLKTEFANKGSVVQLQEAYGTYAFVPDKMIVSLGLRQPKNTGNGSTEYWPFAEALNSSDTLKWAQNDRGIGINGRLLDRKFFYEAQMMNGNGITSDAYNDNYEFLYSLYMKMEPMGEMSASQNDIKFSKPSPGFAFAGARSREKRLAAPGRYPQDKVWYSGTAYLKWSGLYARAMFASLNVDQVNSQAGMPKDQFMWMAHLGYAMRAWGDGIAEPLVRYEELTYNMGAPHTREKRATFGLNYYLSGDKARFALNYVLKRESGSSSIDNDTAQAMYSIFF